MHYYQFHIGDYASHTSHLDELEDLAYRRMLDYCYLNEIGLPESLEEVARLIRMRTQCERIANVLQEFFVLHSDGFYRQGRIESEITAYHGKSDKAKQAARKRWENTHANALPTHSERNANHKPLTNNHKPIKTPVATAPVVPENIDSGSWGDWVEYRRQLKKKMTPATVIKQFTLLEKYPKAIQRDIINQSIQNGWSGLFPVKENGNANPKNSTRQHSNAGRLSAGDRTRQLREQREATLAARASDMGRVVDNA